MWCPSVSLSVWANAWLAGRAAPDDVLDALTAWAPNHSVTAYDSIAAGRTGLPWPDIEDTGLMSLLRTMRAAGGSRPGAGWPNRPAIGLLLPVAGDTRGLSPGSQFASDALAAGEAIVVSGDDGQSVGVVPAFTGDGEEPDCDTSPDWPAMLCWSVYSLPDRALSDRPVVDAPDLGEAEYALRAAVRTAAETLGSLDLAAGGDQDSRALVEEMLEATVLHRAPDHAPERAIRVLSTSARVDAILTVGSGIIDAHSASAARIADDTLRPLASVVRTARAAAVGEILRSAWR